MTRTTRVALTTAALAAALAWPGAAGAAAPTRIDAEYWGIDCVTSLGEGQTLFLFGSGTTDGTEGGVGAFVEDAGGAVVAEGSASELGYGPGFHARVDLAGHVVAIEADVAEGDPVTEPVDERDGNRWTKGTASSAELTVSPTAATYDGVPLALAPGACSGDVHAFDVRSTNPAGYVARDADFDSEICSVDGLPDGQVRVTGALPDAYVEVVLDHGGEDVEKAQGALRLRAGRGALTADLVDLYAGEVRTSATVDLTLERAGSHTREVAAEDGITERRTVTPYREQVRVSLGDGRSGTATCAGIAVDTLVRIAPAHG